MRLTSRTILFHILMISHKHKAIFVHVPKTGGTSITSALSRQGFEGLNLNCADDGSIDDDTGYYKNGSAMRMKRQFSENLWNSYFKFGFVRNPYDRILSNYNFFKGLGSVPFSRFVESQGQNTYQIWHNDITQTQHTNLELDFVGKFENLQTDFDNICKRLNIPLSKVPHLNRSRENNNWKTYFTDNCMKTVYNKYKPDFVNFGYQEF